MTDIAKKHKEARNNFFSQLSFLVSTARWNKNLYKEIEKCKDDSLRRRQSTHSHTYNAHTWPEPRFSPARFFHQ